LEEDLGATGVRARSSSDGVGPSGVKFLEEAGAKPEGSDPEGGDEGVDIDLDDEHESLLDFLNAWQRKDAKSSFRMIPGLPRRIELELLDLFISRWTSN